MPRISIGSSFGASLIGHLPLAILQVIPQAEEPRHPRVRAEVLRIGDPVVQEHAIDLVRQEPQARARLAAACRRFHILEQVRQPCESARRTLVQLRWSAASLACRGDPGIVVDQLRQAVPHVIDSGCAASHWARLAICVRVAFQMRGSLGLLVLRRVSAASLCEIGARGPAAVRHRSAGRRRSSSAPSRRSGPTRSIGPSKPFTSWQP